MSCPLGGDVPAGLLLPLVSLVFCSISSYGAMKVSNCVRIWCMVLACCRCATLPERQPMHPSLRLGLAACEYASHIRRASTSMSDMMPAPCLHQACRSQIHTAQCGSDVQEANPAAAQLALMLYCDEVRKLLIKFSGYECSVRPCCMPAAWPGDSTCALAC